MQQQQQLYYGVPISELPRYPKGHHPRSDVGKCRAALEQWATGFDAPDTAGKTDALRK